MNDEGYSRCAAVLGSLLAAGGYSSTLAILAWLQLCLEQRCPWRLGLMTVLLVRRYQLELGHTRQLLASRPTHAKTQSRQAVSMVGACVPTRPRCYADGLIHSSGHVGTRAPTKKPTMLRVEANVPYHSNRHKKPR